MARVPAGSVDLILCDLPYGTTACKWDVVIPFPALWEQYERIIKPNGAILLFSGEPFTSVLIQSRLPLFKYKWIWDKKFAGNFSTANYRPLNTFEEVVVFYRSQPTYNPQKEQRANSIKSGKRAMPRNRTGTDTVCTYEAPVKFYTDKHPTTILHIPRDLGKNSIHPTQKPVALLEYLNCMGSGTTAIAAINTGRNYIGFENDPVYFDRLQNRIKNHTPQFQLF